MQLRLAPCIQFAARTTLRARIIVDHAAEALVGFGDARDDVVAAKPDPSIFHLATSVLQVKPQQSLVAEDSVAGVRAAKSAGMRCLGIGTGALGSRLYQEGAEQVVPDFDGVSLSQLLSLFLESSELFLNRSLLQ